MSSEPAPEIEVDPFDRQRQVSKQLAAPRLEGYEIIAFIGEGTYGDVWQAKELKTGTVVAIKRLRKQPDQKSRAEVRMLAGLDEARGIVALKSIHLDNEPFCYVMEYVGGGTLASLIAQRGKLSFREAWRYFRELAEALAYVHRHGIVHCDIKPENVLLDSRGNPRLSDFGEARGQGPRGSSLGTRFYMPPEQARLESPDSRWDVYALGAILYQMLTGKKPRYTPQLGTEIKERTQSSSQMRDWLEKYAQHLERSDPPLEHRGLPGVTHEIAAVIDRCLAIDTRGRPADAAEVLLLIDQCQWQRRRRSLLILGGVAPALTLLLAGLVVLFGVYKALQKFEHKWVSQVVSDNQVLAKTIATELEARFSERFRVLRQQALDPEWPTLLANSPDATTQKRIREKLQQLYETQGEQRLRRWTIADSDGYSRSLYGRMPSGKVESDEIGGQNFAWRSWFNASEDEPARAANQTTEEATKTARERLSARRDGGHILFLSQPYCRQSSDPAREMWVLTISCVVPPEATAEPAGVLAGQIDYREFNEAFARFEASPTFERKVVVANERGQIMYHRRLAEQLKQGEASANVRQIDLKKKENHFFAQALTTPPPTTAESAPPGENPTPAAHKDPWYASEDKTEYYISGTSAMFANGQKLAVLVLHDKNIALSGFVAAERYSRWLGFTLLGVGCTMLIGNIWLLRRTLHYEDTTANA